MKMKNMDMQLKILASDVATNEKVKKELMEENLELKESIEDITQENKETVKDMMEQDQKQTETIKHLNKELKLSKENAAAALASMNETEKAKEEELDAKIHDLDEFAINVQM